MSDRSRPKHRCAYVFYATNDAYAVAALVFVRRLRELGLRADLDLVALHHSLSRPLVEAMGELGVVARPVAPLRGKRGGFRDALTKLRLFELIEYDRLVFADVDAMPLRPLDYLFDLPISRPIAAPSAYWLPQPFWTSALLVVEPSSAFPPRLAPHLRTARRDRRYDMDIVNAEFGGETHTLPPETFCLSSEWEEAGRPGHFADPVEALATVSLVHFTALGKPWSYSPGEARRLRPHAHPAFYELFEAWRTTRDDLLGAIGLSQRARGRDPTGYSLRVR
jgi:hypothetical protein